jgi:hypothetical protein
MKKIFTLFTVCSFAIAAHAQTTMVAADPHAGHDHGATATTTAPVAPVAEDALALKETEHDFGKIPQGKPVTTIFEVTNTGKAPFKLDNVQASCGCTTPQWDKEKVIAPGEKSEITVGYNAAAEGFFTKTVTITYNGTQSKQVIIKGEVWKTPASSAPANTGLNDLKN